MTCKDCGWLEINPSGAMFCGYSDERTWENESCLAWKDKDEPKTNADRIRAMTDEELAKSITDDLCDRVCHSPLSCDGNCETQVLDWLKQEADND